MINLEQMPLLRDTLPTIGTQSPATVQNENAEESGEDDGDLIPLLDAAGIKRAAVLSTAYIFSQQTRNVESRHEKVRADNEWTSSQVALFPDRLVGFCSVSPVEDR